jgi:hypothetical protein
MYYVQAAYTTTANRVDDELTMFHKHSRAYM